MFASDKKGLAHSVLMKTFVYLFSTTSLHVQSCENEGSKVMSDFLNVNNVKLDKLSDFGAHPKINYHLCPEAFVTPLILINESQRNLSGNELPCTWIVGSLLSTCE